MKLSSALVQRTLSQFDAQAIPDNHPVVPQLKGLFGDHTFFLDGNGLHIVELIDTTEGETNAGKVVAIASWTDENRTSLVPHDPEPTDIVILFGTDRPDNAA
jgi:hypothetical protein